MSTTLRRKSVNGKSWHARLYENWASNHPGKAPKQVNLCTYFWRVVWEGVKHPVGFMFAALIMLVATLVALGFIAANIASFLLVIGMIERGKVNMTNSDLNVMIGLLLVIDLVLIWGATGKYIKSAVKKVDGKITWSPIDAIKLFLKGLPKPSKRTMARASVLALIVSFSGFVYYLVSQHKIVDALKTLGLTVGVVTAVLAILYVISLFSEKIEEAVDGRKSREHVGILRLGWETFKNWKNGSVICPLIDIDHGESEYAE